MRKRLGDATALAILVAPVVILAARLRSRGGDCAVLFNPLDVRLVNYLLEWGYRHLIRGAPGELWSPPFFYPTRHVLGYSDTFISAYPFYFAFRLAGLSPEKSLLVYQLSQLALTAAVAYLCARWVGLRRLTAFLAAWCFAWGWPRYNQLVHLQFAAGWVVPLFYSSLYLAWRQQRPWLLALAAATLCDAFYTSVYTAYFVVLTAGVGLVLVALQKRPKPPPLRAPWIAATTVSLVLIAIGAWKYRLAVRDLGQTGTHDEALTYQASIWSWLRPEGDGLVWRWLAGIFPADPVAPWEKQVFLGWVTLALVIWAAISARNRPAVRAAAWTAIASIILVSHFPLRPLNWPFEAAFRLLPGFAALRASGRIALVLAALTALVAATMIEQLGSSRPFLAGAAAVLMLAENVTPLPPIADRCEGERPWKALQPEICAIASKAQAGTVMFLPMDEISFDRIFMQVPEMTLSLDCGLATINGYTGREPKELAGLLHGDPSKFDCRDARRVVDSARQESGKSVLIYIEEAGALGPPAYPPTSVHACFEPCLTATTKLPGRGEILAIASAGRCSIDR